MAPNGESKNFTKYTQTTELIICSNAVGKMGYDWTC